MAKPTRVDGEMIANYRAQGYWDDKGIPDILMENAQRYPDQEALVDSESRRTWAELDHVTNRVAYGLMEMGIKRDQALVAQIPSPTASLILLLSCQKAGVLCCFPPMTFRRNEMKHVLKTLHAAAVMTPMDYRNTNYHDIARSIAQELPELKHLMVMGDRTPAGIQYYKDLLETPMHNEDLLDVMKERGYSPFEVSMIVLTSGTTGMPKCIENMGASCIAGGRGIVQRAKLNRKDIVGNIAPVSGGPGLQNWWAAFQIGARVCTLARFSPEETLRLIEREKITYLAAIPTQIIKILKQVDVTRYDLSSLRVIRTGAASFDAALARETEDRFQCKVLIAGGSQETYSFGQSAVDDPREKRLGTLGRPFPGNEIKITDDNGKMVSKGEVGHLHVRGATTSSGYYGDPEATLEAWGEFGKEGWYCTGDLARMDEEGYLILAGRKKEIIIRGGQNIYPKEIEDVLLTHPGVMQAVVIRIPDPVMGERACACITTCGKITLRFEEMVSFLKEKGLAVHKLPERLEVLDTLPLLVEGQKVDKMALEKRILERMAAEERVG